MAVNRQRIDDRAMNAAMPAAPSERFEAARKSTEQRAAQSVGALDKMSLNEVVATGAGTGTTGAKIDSESKDGRADAAARAGDHLFARRNGRWTDVAFKEGMKVVQIKAFTPAYFKVLDAMPELRASFAVGEHVLVAGKHVAIEISDAGAEQLGDAELRSLKEQW